MEKNALDSAKVERLLLAADAQEARRILAEYGWPDTGNDEENASEHLKKACLTLKELATDPKLIDAFLTGYDIANLKILLKARCLESEPSALSPCGVLPPDDLRHAVFERRYDSLPAELKAPLDALEKRLAVRVDPMDIDITLDKAHYKWALKLLPPRRKAAGEYFTARIDTLNCQMALRAMHREKSAAFLAPMLIDGGSHTPEKWLKAFSRPDTLPIMVNQHGAEVYAAAIAAMMDEEKLAHFERVCADRLLAFFTPFKRRINADERLIGHLFLRDREAAAVRLIMVGKENGFAPDTIRERLRDLYA